MNIEDFYFPFIDKRTIKIPTELANYLSQVSFSTSSIWTLPSISNSAIFYITFFEKKLFVWQENKLLSSTIIGRVNKNNAIIFSNNSLYYLTTNGELFFIQEIFNCKNSLDNKKSFKNITKIKHISQCTNNSIYVLTGQQIVYTLDSDGNQQKKKSVPIPLSYFKYLLNNNYGLIQNTLYRFDENFKITAEQVFNDLYSISEISALNSQTLLISGLSHSNKLIIYKTDNYGSIEASSPQLGVNYGLISSIGDKETIVLVYDVGIIVFDSDLSVISKVPFARPNFLIWSTKVRNDQLFIFLSKSGLHNLTHIVEETEVDEENLPYTMFYNLKLYMTTNSNHHEEQNIELEDNRNVTDNFRKFIQNCRPDDISKAEKAFLTKRTDFSYEMMIELHKNLVKMIKSSKNADNFFPYLNTNLIFINLINNCAKDDKFYRYANFRNIDKIFDSVDPNFSKLLLESIQKSLQISKKKIISFDGADKLLELVEKLLISFSEKDGVLTSVLVECKLLLTNYQAIVLDDVKPLIQKHTNLFEKLALKYRRFEILAEIIASWTINDDFKRAERYAEETNGECVEPVYKLLAQNPIRRRLAAQRGWEKVDKFVVYQNGAFKQTDDREDGISANALAILCEMVDDHSEEMKNAREQLSLKLFPE